MKYYLFPILLMTLLLPCNASASPNLHFKKAEGYKQLKAVSYVKASNEAAEEYLIAKVDLNDDFIDEYIIKPAECKTRHLCSFRVIVFMNKKPTEIGRFDAHKIVISNDKNYGVKALKVYNQTSNDFTNKNARWDPYEFKYVYK